MTSVVPPTTSSTPPPLPPRADRRRKPPHTTKSDTQPAKNLTSPIVQAAQDVEHARRLLDAPTVDDSLDDAEKEIHRMVREREVIQLLMRMTDWVEELSSLLQQSYKKESELEGTLALAQSNNQASANHELEESKRPVSNGSALKEFAWRPWSKRDNRRTSDEETSSHNIEDTLTPLPKPQSPRNSVTSSASVGASSTLPTTAPSTPSRFFNFASLTRNSSPSIVSTPPLLEPAPPPKPTQREKELAQHLEKERESLRIVMSEKAALESELETLSQALFEQANKMVSNSNRKLAEIEEELRIAMEEREALKSTLRVIASHNKPGDVVLDRVSVDVSSFNHDPVSNDPSTPRAYSRSSSRTSSLIFELSPMTPHPNRAARTLEYQDDDDDYGEHIGSVSPSANDDPRREEEPEPEKASSNKEPDDSVYSRSESSYVPPHPPTEEEAEVKSSIEVEANEGSKERASDDTKQDSEQAPGHDLVSIPTSPAPSPSNTEPTPEEEPGLNPSLDMAPGSPVSQYTLDSIHQNI